MAKSVLKATNVNHVETPCATQVDQTVSIAPKNEQSSTNAEIKNWLNEDDRKKEKAIFKAKLKYGEHWAGTTTLNPGQRIRVINGKIVVD